MSPLPFSPDPSWYERTWMTDTPRRSPLRLVRRLIGAVLSAAVLSGGAS